MRDLSAEIIGLLSPRPASSPWQWEHAESEIGTRVPQDYKALVGSLGGASIIDDCLCVLEPDSRETHLDFANLVFERDSAWRLIKDRGLVALPEKYFTGIRLVPFAFVEANYLYWVSPPGTPEDQWGVLIVDADLEDWHEFDMSATECIYGLLVGRIEFPVFEGLFSHSPHTVSRL